MYWLLIILCAVILVYAFAGLNMRMACKNLYG
jgi:hypothetical protein